MYCFVLKKLKFAILSNMKKEKVQGHDKVTGTLGRRKRKPLINLKPDVT